MCYDSGEEGGYAAREDNQDDERSFEKGVL